MMSTVPVRQVGWRSSCSEQSEQTVNGGWRLRCRENDGDYPEEMRVDDKTGPHDKVKHILTRQLCSNLNERVRKTICWRGRRPAHSLGLWLRFLIHDHTISPRY